MAVSCRKAAAAAAERHFDVALVMCINWTGEMRLLSAAADWRGRYVDVRVLGCSSRKSYIHKSDSTEAQLNTEQISN